MWKVLNNRKPANGTSYHLSNEDWGKSEFPSYEEAHEYALNWLGQWGKGLKLQPNTPYDYSGYGDIIEIKQI